jgi:hypothetical protein
MPTHAAKVPLLHGLYYTNSNVRKFIVPETSNSRWNFNISNLDIAGDLNWHLNSLVCIQFCALTGTEICYAHGIKMY